MIKIPFLNLREANLPIEPEILDAVNRVVKSGWFILGNELKNFERLLADDLRGKNFGFVAGCNSGTDALILSLKAAGVNRGDEVITVSHTAIPTVAAIVTVGAIPVFVDIDPATWVMDVRNLKAAVTPKTKAIVPVHLYGNMVDVHAIKKILRELNRGDIKIVEDCAQAQGSTLQNLQAGTLGDFGVFSFYPSKNIGALGDAGAVFTADESAHKKILSYRNYGQKDRYHADVIGGLNSRLDEIQAAVLSVKLKHLHTWIAQKSRLMDAYRTALADTPLTFQTVTQGCSPAWHLCVVKLNENFSRDDFQNRLLDAGLQTLVHYPLPNHLQPAFQKFHRVKLPVTESLANQILSLPFSHALDESTLNKITAIIKSVANQFK